MSILSWNVRDLGNTRTFHELKDILQKHQPRILFLCETKLKYGRMMSTGKRLGLYNCFVVGKSCMGGGLAMLWKDDLDLEIASYSNHHIDAIVREVDGKQWRCTGIYGHPEVGQKRHTWTLLKRLAGLFTYPWICFGDFNEILNPNEKISGNDRNLNMVDEFREAVRECKLANIECRGYRGGKNICPVRTKTVPGRCGSSINRAL